MAYKTLLVFDFFFASTITMYTLVAWQKHIYIYIYIYAWSTNKALEVEILDN